ACGIARGYSPRLFMLAHEPFESPIDYQTLLRRHKTAAECRRLANTWLAPVEQDIASHQQRVADALQAQELTATLRALSLGDFIAENEEASLGEYFVPTSPYTDALRGQQTIFVGRKGTG